MDRATSLRRELRDAGFDKRVPLYLFCGSPRLLQVHALDDRRVDRMQAQAHIGEPLGKYSDCLVVAVVEM